MKSLLTLSLAGVLLLGLAHAEQDVQAPAPAPAPAAEAPSVQTWAIDAGTTAMLVEDHRVPLYSLRVQVPVGTDMPWTREHHAQEAWELSHYDPEGRLRARADALAASLSLQMQDNRAVLSISGLTRDLDASVALVKEILANRAYDPKELKRTGQGQTIGWKGNLKDPDFRRSQAAFGLLLQPGDARLGAWEEPEPVSRNSTELAAARDAMLGMPGRVVGLSGDLDRARAESILASLLPPVSASPPSAPRGVLPLRQDRPAEAVETMNPLTQVYVAWFRDGVAWGDDAYAASRVANHVLGGHFFSRLYVALRHEGGDTYGVSAGGGSGLEPGLYQIATFTRLDNKDATVTKLKEAVATFREGGITEQERVDALSFLGGRLLLSKQAPDQILARSMQLQSYGLPLDFDDQVLAKTKALSLEEINAFIRGYYDPAKFTLLTVEPG